MRILRRATGVSYDLSRNKNLDCGTGEVQSYGHTSSHRETFILEKAHPHFAQNAKDSSDCPFASSWLPFSGRFRRSMHKVWADRPSQLR